MKLKYIVFMLLAAVLISCGPTTHVDTRIKVVSANTDYKQISAIYASDSNAEVRNESVVDFYTADNELFSELRNNIGAVYDISFNQNVTGKTIIKAVKLQR
jgi:hypothetical protein